MPEPPTEYFGLVQPPIDGSWQSILFTDTSIIHLVNKKGQELANQKSTFENDGTLNKGIQAKDSIESFLKIIQLKNIRNHMTRYL